MTGRHNLLARQIRRYLGGEDAVPAEWQPFLDAVDAAYLQLEVDRSLLERSMDLSSQELMQANSEMRAIFQALPDLFFRFTGDGRILDCKAGNRADLFLTVPELIGRRIQNIPVREVGERFAEAIDKVRATGSVVRIEYSLAQQLYEARLLPLRSKQMIAIVRNITELKATEEALRQSENEVRQSLSLLQATFESTADGILVVDREGRIVTFNRRFVELWQLPDDLLQAREPGQVIARVLSQFKEPEAFLAEVMELHAEPEAGSRGVLEFLDGRVFEHYSQPQRIGGEHVGRVFSFRDVTELRRAEEERARLQVMGSLGHLVGGLAHEVRNPLFAISATLEALAARLEDTEPSFVRQAIDNLREPTARLTELMSELLEYGKPLGQNLVADSLDAAISQAVAECGALAAERGVELRVRSRGPELQVAMIRRRLVMALTNLLQNAIQHTPPAGAVTVELEELACDGEAWARCTIKDSGAGFQVEDLARIFEPFFTRRPGGTGLGLPIVQRIVDEHGGRIAIGNRSTGGAVVTLELPLAAVGVLAV
ncbi:MAG TPA: ATP-binding protein [Thermoanaerobaculia bacterium]|jgi:PAS domain S-box-containing protein|nr:ATP-binding protein [Thermoanaerobaculia bacterium]